MRPVSFPIHKRKKKSRESCATRAARGKVKSYTKTVTMEGLPRFVHLRRANAEVPSQISQHLMRSILAPRPVTG